jgi:hypothetical protein
LGGVDGHDLCTGRVDDHTKKKKKSTENKGEQAETKENTVRILAKIVCG